VSRKAKKLAVHGAVGAAGDKYRVRAGHRADTRKTVLLK
jgi:hypothetical protein